MYPICNLDWAEGRERDARLAGAELLLQRLLEQSANVDQKPPSEVRGVAREGHDSQLTVFG